MDFYGLLYLHFIVAVVQAILNLSYKQLFKVTTLLKIVTYTGSPRFTIVHLVDHLKLERR